MKSSKQSRRESKALFQACLVDGRMDDDRVRETVRRVIEAKPRGAKLLLDHFTRLVRIAVARRTARVETAFPYEQPVAGNRSPDRRGQDRWPDRTSAPCARSATAWPKSKGLTDAMLNEMLDFGRA
jgi:hypothetical protein